MRTCDRLGAALRNFSEEKYMIVSEVKRMKARVFKRVMFDANRQLALVEFVPEPLRRAKYEEAIQVAADSKVPDPKYSNYFVQGSIGTLSSPSLPIGNIEYGLCQALHCEEVAVAVLRSVNPEALKNPSEIVLAFAAKRDGETLTPCGNCRDILRDAFGESFTIICGSPDGGVVVVAKMSDMLFSDYQKIASPNFILPGKLLEEFLEVQTFSTSLPAIMRQGKRIECDPYSPPNQFITTAVNPERKYSSCIVTERNAYFGAHYVRCEYHPVYAGEIAGIRDELARDYSPIRAVYFVRETDSDIPPDVMYRDRQHLMELTFGRELVLGEKLNPPVYLGAVCDEKITNVWRTTVKEWLPDRFSPHNFGDEYNAYLRMYHMSRAHL